MNPEQTPFPMTILLTVIALVFVLVLAWLALKLLARTSSLGVNGKQGRIRIVQSVPVGPRDRVLLLNVDGEEWVIGVSAGGITRLDRGPSKSVTHSGELEPTRQD